MSKPSPTDDWCGPTTEIDRAQLGELLQRARGNERGEHAGLASGSQHELAAPAAPSLREHTDDRQAMTEPAPSLREHTDDRQAMAQPAPSLREQTDDRQAMAQPAPSLRERTGDRQAMAEPALDDQVTASVIVDPELATRDPIATEPLRPLGPRRPPARTERVRARLRALTPPALPIYRTTRRSIAVRIVLALCAAGAVAAGVVALAS